MDPEVANALFTKTSVLSLQGSAAASLIVPNVLKYLIPNIPKWLTKWISFVIAMGLSFLVAYIASETGFMKWVVAFFNGFLVFASAMGINQAAAGGAALGPGRRKFFDNWL
ncbi:MAG: hypothetical protein M3R52_06660 [Acidobacteriota bacterium]|nr:hypothetical protein [Acidobacteriota bacterium]